MFCISLRASWFSFLGIQYNQSLVSIRQLPNSEPVPSPGGRGSKWMDIKHFFASAGYDYWPAWDGRV